MLSNKTSKRILISCIFIVFFAGVYLLNSTMNYHKPEDMPVGIVYENAVVTNIVSEVLEPDPDFPYINIGKQQVELKILKGENKGRIITVNNFIGRVDNRPLKIGNKVVISSYDDFVTTTIVNYNRENAMYILLAIFVLVVILVGKSKGVKSLLALVFTMICVIFLLIPLVIKGMNPILASIIVVILSTLVTMLSLNGLSKKTIVAISSCILCTVIAGIVAYVFGAVTNVSSYNTAEAQDLLFVAMKTPIKIRDILFAEILISSLGATMDTTMSMASSIFEMKSINNSMTKMQLLKSGMNIGKDIMGTMTNTLILAFTGSSINILIIYYMYSMPYMQLINMDLIVIELIQGLSGGIAVMLSIPITAIMASTVACRKINNKYIEKYL